MADVKIELVLEAVDRSLELLDNVNGRLDEMENAQRRTTTATRQAETANSRQAEALGRLAMRILAAVAAYATLDRALTGQRAIFAYGAELDHLSDRTGFLVRDLAILRRAFEDNGASADGVGRTINFMQKQLAEASQGIGEGKIAFEQMTLQIGDLLGLDPVEQFAALSAEIGTIEDPARRSAIAMRLFGESGTELLPLFANGGAIDDARESLGALPAILERNAEQFERIDTLLGRLPDKSRQVFAGIGDIIGEDLLAKLEAANEIDFTLLGQRIGAALQAPFTEDADLVGLIRLALLAGAEQGAEAMEKILVDVVTVVFSKEMVVQMSRGAVLAAELLATAFEAPVVYLTAGLRFAVREGIDELGDALRGELTAIAQIAQVLTPGGAGNLVAAILQDETGASVEERIEGVQDRIALLRGQLQGMQSQLAQTDVAQPGQAAAMRDLVRTIEEAQRELAELQAEADEPVFDDYVTGARIQLDFLKILLGSTQEDIEAFIRTGGDGADENGGRNTLSYADEFLARLDAIIAKSEEAKAKADAVIEGEGGGAQVGGQIGAVRDELDLAPINDFEVLEQHLEELEEYYAQKQAMADAALNQERLSFQEHEELKTEIQQRYDDQRRQIQLSQAAFASETAATSFDQLLFASEVFFGKHSEQYRVMFEVMKAFAIADATIKGIQATLNVYQSASAIPYVGWILGPVAAASTAAYTAAQIAMIASSQPAFEAGGLVPGGRQSITVNERGEEFVVNNPATRNNREFLEVLNRTGSAELAAMATGAGARGGAGRGDDETSAIFHAVGSERDGRRFRDRHAGEVQMRRLIRQEIAAAR